MLGLSHILQQWLGSDRVTEMAQRIAGRSRMQVWQRVLEQLPQLGAIEARGYVRARAIGVVREETQRLVEQEGAGVARQRDKIEAAALDLLIRSIAEQQQQQRRQMPARRAA